MRCESGPTKPTMPTKTWWGFRWRNTVGARNSVPVCGVPGFAFVAGDHLGFARRIQPESGQNLMAEKACAVELFDGQDRTIPADCVLYFARPCVWVHHPGPGLGGVSATFFDVYHVPLWTVLGAERPEKPVSGLHALRYAPGAGGTGFANFSGLEWHGDDVLGRAYVAACAESADELVQRTTVALSRYFLGFSVRGVDAAHSLRTASRAPAGVSSLSDQRPWSKGHGDQRDTKSMGCELLQ